MTTEPATDRSLSHRQVLVDLGYFLAAMYAIRMISVPGIPYMGNVLLNSLLTLAVASWRMNVSGFSWRDLGLRQPENLAKSTGVVAFILAAVIISIVLFEAVVQDAILGAQEEQASSGQVDTRFQGLAGNFPYLIAILIPVWIESALEELLDRGFLLTWLERLFMPVSFATALAVLLQAAIFGFRHAATHGIDGAITTAIIGLVFGIAYVAFGRNLWPLIVAHGILNSMSMVERFLQ